VYRQQVARLGQVERQAVVADLAQPTVEPQPGESDGGIRPAADDDIELGRRPLNQVVERGEGVGGGQRLDVVEDQDDVLPCPFQPSEGRVEQRRAGHRGLACLHVEHPPLDQRRNDETGEVAGLVVTPVDRNGHGVAASSQGCRDQRRLSRAGGSGDERDRTALTVREQRVEPGTWDVGLGQARRTAPGPQRRKVITHLLLPREPVVGVSPTGWSLSPAGTGHRSELPPERSLRSVWDSPVATTTRAPRRRRPGS
jgi:hypothetical protein